MKAYWIALVVVVGSALGANIYWDPRGQIRRADEACLASPIPAVIHVPERGRADYMAFNRYAIDHAGEIGLAVFGSSHAFAIDAKTFQAPLHARILWVPGGSLASYQSLWAQLQAKPVVPRKLLWLVDPFIFNGDQGGVAEPVDADGGVVAAKGRLFRLFDTTAFAEAFDRLAPDEAWDLVPQVLPAGQVKKKGVYYFDGGLAIYFPKRMAYQENRKAAFWLFMADWRMAPEKADAFEVMLKEMRDRGIEVMAVLPPLSPVLRRKLEGQAFRQAFPQCMQRLKELEGKGLLTTNDHWISAGELGVKDPFVDGADHMTPEAAYRFLKVVFRGKPEWLGCLVTEEENQRVWEQRRLPFLRADAPAPGDKI